MNHKLTAIGVGSAFADSTLWQSMYVIEAPSGRRMMVDCGSDARHALAEHKLSYKDIEGVYISHLHSDHVGGLEYMALSSYFDPNYKDRMTLFINSELAKECWTRSLQGGLLTLQMEQAKLETFFDVKKIPAGRGFQWEGLFFQTVQVVHIVSNFAFSNSYGLIITKESLPSIGDETLPSFNLKEMELDDQSIFKGRRVFITTDTQFAPGQMTDFYDMSDVIIQDCETYSFRSKVHAHYDDLKTLPKETKAKMHLVHYNPGFEKREAAADGFCGFLEKGYEIEF